MNKIKIKQVDAFTTIPLVEILLVSLLMPLTFLMKLSRMWLKK